MADFSIALAKVLRREGGYVNDPDDKGGETYKGISRRAYPKSNLWTIVDRYKQECGGVTTKFKQKLAKDEEITNIINTIYKKNYWNVFKLDLMLNQKLAEQIFDDAVNRGVGAACKLLCGMLHLPISSKPSDKLLQLLKTY